MSEGGGRDVVSGGRFGRRRMLQLTGVSTLGTLVLDTAAGMEDEGVEEGEDDQGVEVDEDEGAKAESAHQVTVSGPSSVEVGGSYRFQAGGYEGWGNYEYSWSSSGTISGDGKSVTITFDSEGAHWVSVSVFDLDQGVPLGSDQMDVEVVAEEVEMELEGPAEIVMDRTATFTAHPDPGDAAFARIDWDVLYVNDDEFDVSTDDDGLTAEIEFHTEGTRTVRIEYETDQGYRDSETALLEVVDLDWYVNKKLALSDEVTRLSASIDERRRVEPVLQSIEQRARDGVVAPTTARDAINRMRLAEDVTEKAFAGLGPDVAKSPEENLVGEPPGSIPTKSRYHHPVLPFAAEVNLFGETIGSLFWVGLGALTGAKILARAKEKVPTSEIITDAKDVFWENVGAIANFGLHGINFMENISSLVKECMGFIESEEEDDGDRIVDYITSPLTTLRDDVAETVRDIFETGDGIRYSTFENHLDQVNNEMSGEGSGEIHLQGTQNGAESAAETGSDRVLSRLERGLQWNASSDFMSIAGDAIASLAVILLAGGVLGIMAAVGFGLLGTAMTLMAETADVLNGITQIYSIREIHEQSLDGIIAGSDWA